MPKWTIKFFSIFLSLCLLLESPGLDGYGAWAQGGLAQSRPAPARAFSLQAWNNYFAGLPSFQKIPFAGPLHLDLSLSKVREAFIQTISRTELMPEDLEFSSLGEQQAGRIQEAISPYVAGILEQFPKGISSSTPFEKIRPWEKSLDELSLISYAIPKAQQASFHKIHRELQEYRAEKFIEKEGGALASPFAAAGAVQAESSFPMEKPFPGSDPPQAASDRGRQEIPGPSLNSTPAAAQLSDSEIAEALSQSKSLRELEQKLKSKGLLFKNTKKLVSFIEDSWRRIQKEKLLAILLSPPPDKVDDLPTLTVRRGRITFHLHGIVHGGYPGWNPSMRVKDFISGKSRQYAWSYASAVNDEIYSEQNLGEFLNLFSAELSDHNPPGWNLRPPSSPLKQQIKEFGLLLFRGVFFPFALIVLVAFFWAGSLLASKTLAERLQSPDLFALYINKKSLRDERYQHTAFNFTLERDLPAPLEIEISAFKEKNSWLNPFSLIFNILTGPLASDVQRSYYTAQELERRAELHLQEFKEDVVVHYIGGMGHTSQLAYFLSLSPAEQRNLERELFENPSPGK